jgi:hypothetical protein
MSRFHTAHCAPPFAPGRALLALLAAALLLPTSLWAGDRVKGASERVDPEQETVELFAGIQQGQLEAKLIVASSPRCHLTVKNLTDRPLNVQFPAAFAGVPVLAQQGLFDDNFGNMNQNAPQQVGGGFPQNNWMNNNNNNNMNNNFFNVPNNRRQNPMPGPLFNIAPEKVGKFKLQCVCLEHGKPSPGPRIPYEIKPIESVSKKPEVAVVCAMLGREVLGQKAAQAAAWHFANGLSWKELHVKQKSIAMGRIHEPYFTSRELAAAKKAAERAEKFVKENQKASTSDSLSRK